MKSNTLINDLVKVGNRDRRRSKLIRHQSLVLREVTKLRGTLVCERDRIPYSECRGVKM